MMQLVSEYCIRPLDFAFDRFGVRIEQELRRVEEKSVRRAPRAVDPVPVPLAGANVGHVAVMSERSDLLEPDASLGVLIIEET
jgi:hypothetical protein